MKTEGNERQVSSVSPTLSLFRASRSPQVTYLPLVQVYRTTFTLVMQPLRRDNTPTRLGRFLWPPNTVSMDTKTAIAKIVIVTAKQSRALSPQRSQPPRRQRDATTAWVQSQYTCRERARFRVARNAAPCCRQFRRPVYAQSAASRCTPASSACISIRAAASSACSLSRNV